MLAENEIRDSLKVRVLAVDTVSREKYHTGLGEIGGALAGFETFKEGRTSWLGVVGDT